MHFGSEVTQLSTCRSQQAGVRTSGFNGVLAGQEVRELVFCFNPRASSYPCSLDCCYHVHGQVVDGAQTRVWGYTFAVPCYLSQIQYL